MKLIVQILGIVLMGGASLEGKDRSFEELMGAMKEAEKSWEGKDEYNKLRREFVDTWTEAEIVTSGTNLRFALNEDHSDPILERWGFLDHEAALKFYLDYVENDISKRSNEWISLSTNFREIGYQSVGFCFGRTLIGWAQKDSKAAWKYAIDPSRRFAHKDIQDNLNWNLTVNLMSLVARNDPDFARREFLKAEKCGIHRAIIVEGIAKGYPQGSNWEKLFSDLIENVERTEGNVLSVWRGELLSRWMEDDVQAAVAWYRSPAGDFVSKVTKRVKLPEKGEWDGFAIDGEYELIGKKISLANATAYWLRRDGDAAMIWLRDWTELIPEVIGCFGTRWRNPSERLILRRVLVFFLNKIEREKLIGVLLKRHLNGGFEEDALGNLIGSSNSPEERRKEIDGLKIRDELAAEILEILK